MSHVRYLLWLYRQNSKFNSEQLPLTISHHRQIKWKKRDETRQDSDASHTIMTTLTFEPSTLSSVKSLIISRGKKFKFRLKNFSSCNKMHNLYDDENIKVPSAHASVSLVPMTMNFIVETKDKKPSLNCKFLISTKKYILFYISCRIQVQLECRSESELTDSPEVTKTSLQSLLINNYLKPTNLPTYSWLVKLDATNCSAFKSITTHTHTHTKKINGREPEMEHCCHIRKKKRRKIRDNNKPFPSNVHPFTLLYYTLCS